MLFTGGATCINRQGYSTIITEYYCTKEGMVTNSRVLVSCIKEK
jgi:hypothetical protein